MVVPGAGCRRPNPSHPDATFLEHFDKECPNVWLLKHLAINFGKLDRKFCEAPLWVLT
jgi:hypothetical protein